MERRNLLVRKVVGHSDVWTAELRLTECLTNDTLQLHFDNNFNTMEIILTKPTPGWLSFKISSDLQIMFMCQNSYINAQFLMTTITRKEMENYRNSGCYESRSNCWLPFHYRLIWGSFGVQVKTIHYLPGFHWALHDNFLQRANCNRRLPVRDAIETVCTIRVFRKHNSARCTHDQIVLKCKMQNVII